MTDLDQLTSKVDLAQQELVRKINLLMRRTRGSMERLVKEFERSLPEGVRMKWYWCTGPRGPSIELKIDYPTVDTRTGEIVVELPD